MEAYQERVVQEKKELDEKLGKLRGFIKGETFDTIPPAEQLRLVRQEHVMTEYSEILEERISKF